MYNLCLVGGELKIFEVDQNQERDTNLIIIVPIISPSLGILSLQPTVARFSHLLAIEPIILSHKNKVNMKPNNNEDHI